MKPYDAFNWYWIVANDETRRYGSVARDYIPISDLAYIEWANDGTQPTRIDTEYNLGVVLGAYHPRVKKPLPVEIARGYDDRRKADAADTPGAEALIDHENRIADLEQRVAVLEGQPARRAPG